MSLVSFDNQRVTLLHFHNGLIVEFELSGSLQQGQPFVLWLVVPESRGRYMAQRNDLFQAKTATIDKRLDRFFSGSFVLW